MLKLEDFIEAFQMINNDDRWMNIKTGEVYTKEDFEIEEMTEEEIDDLLYNDDIVELPTQYELKEYKDMKTFVDGLSNEKIKNSLYQSLSGKGAFRRFKDEIIIQGVRQEWFNYRDECLKKKVIKWLEEKNIKYIK